MTKTNLLWNASRSLRELEMVLALPGHKFYLKALGTPVPWPIGKSEAEEGGRDSSSSLRELEMVSLQRAIRKTS